MDISRINPYIRVAMRSVLPAATEISRRIIFDYELIYIEDGSFTLSYDETDYSCKKGDFLLIRPNIPHRFHGIRQDLSQPHIHFDITWCANSPLVPICFKDAPELSKQERSMVREDVFKDYPRTPFVFFQHPEEILELFYMIVDHPSGFDLGQKAKFLCILERLIGENYPEVFSRKPEKYPIEKEVKDYIDAGPRTACSLTNISKQFNYSKYHLDRKFKSRYGISIVAYSNLLRMQRARQMLSTHSVTQVAESLGFSSIYAFSRAYKNHFGVSPQASKP